MADTSLRSLYFASAERLERLHAVNILRAVGDLRDTRQNPAAKSLPPPGFTRPAWWEPVLAPCCWQDSVRVTPTLARQF